MANAIKVTSEGLVKLQEELKYLTEVKRKEVVEAIEVARSYGDLSENSEYDEAKTEQGRVEGRIRELEEMLGNVVVVDGGEGKVDVGSVVVVNNLTKGKEIEYSIVGASEANPMQGKISDRSPIGMALMGCRAGAKVEVETPVGVIALEIISVK